MQAAKSARVDYTIAVTLEFVAIGMLRLRMAASTGILDPYRELGQH